MAGQNSIKDDAKSLVVGDNDMKIHGCRAVFGFGNQLFTYAGKGSDCKETSGSGCDGPFIHEVLWNTDMHGPATRKIVCESHNIFLRVQDFAKSNERCSDKPQMIQFSREYRAVIKACLVDLQKAAGSCMDGELRRELQAQMQLFTMVELVWSLCQILLLETTGGSVLSQLLDWLRWHFLEADHNAREVLRNEPPQAHPSYWNTVYSFVLQGRRDEARQLLSVHSSSNEAVFQSIDELLAKMPLYTEFKGHSMSEFKLKWDHWQKECSQRLEEQEYATHANIETISRILCGEDSVFTEMRDLCESWYGMLVSRLLFKNPCVKPQDLQYHIQFCVNAYGGNTELQPWDNILLAAIEFDVHQVIKEASSSSGNWWFVAHLTDLLHHCDILESQTLCFGSNLREFLLLEYANSLMAHNSLWQVGISYFDHCPEFGRSHIEHYIEKMPIDSERKAEKVIHICEKRGLVDQARSICQIQGLAALHSQRLGSALSWALRSKDVAFVTNLSERFLSEYIASGDLSNLDLIDNLGSSMLLSSKLTFLGSYRQFHLHYEQGDFMEAASLLISLITDRIAPQRFWVALLTDALPLLETDEVILSSQQTYEIMHCLEEYSISKQLATKANATQPAPLVGKKADEEIESQKLEMLKLALARNLARAILKEGNIDSAVTPETTHRPGLMAR